MHWQLPYEPLLKKKNKYVPTIYKEQIQLSTEQQMMELQQHMQQSLNDEWVDSVENVEKQRR